MKIKLDKVNMNIRTEANHTGYIDRLKLKSVK